MKTIRISICLLVAFSVLANGTVEPWSEGVLEIGAALLLVAWGLLFASGNAPVLRWHVLLWPVASLWSYGLLQNLTGISAVPFLTHIELLKWGALGILLFLAVQAFETLDQWRGFAWFVLVLGFLTSVLGILQYFTFNGKLYWFRVMHYGGVPFGPFVNRNHFAGFVELVVPLGLAMLLLRVEDRDRAPLLAILTLLPIGALFLSASRGGIVSFFVELGVVLILTLLWQRGRKQLVAAATLLLLAAGLVGWLGIGRALNRFASYRALEVSDARRAEMTRDTFRVFLAHPLLGTGLGTLQEVFPRYESLYDGRIVIHAHDDYVEALANTGLVGGLCGLIFLLLFFRRSWGRLSGSGSSMDLAIHLGAFAACCGLLVHSFVDFNLHIPSNALLFLLEAALATSVTPSSRLAGGGTDRKHRQKSGIAIATDSV